jgi:hypothetical protein
VSTLSAVGKRERHFKEDTVLMNRKPAVRQLLLPLDLQEVVPVPAEKQAEVEQVLADLLLSAAGAEAEEDARRS